MRALVLVASLVCCTSAPEEQEADKPFRARWLRHAGDGATQFGYGVAVDRDRIYVVGEYGGAIDFGAGAIDNRATVSGFVARFERDGRAVWTRRVGGTGDASAYVVAAHGGHVFVGGYFKGVMEGRTSAGESDAYLLELDESGATVALRTFGDSGSQAITALSVDDDAITIAGDFDGRIDELVSAGATDLFLIQLARDGTRRFAKRFGGTELDRRPRLAMDKDSIYMAATYRGAFAVGAMLPSAHDGAFVARLDRRGEPLWTKPFPGDGWCFPTALSIDSRGAVAIGARFTRTLDVGRRLVSESGEDGMVAIFERDGALRFAERYGGFGQDAVSGLAFAGDDLFLTGELQVSLGPMTSRGAADAFVARLRRGELDWFRTWGDHEEQRATRVAIDPLGGVVVVGSFFGRVTLDQHSAISAGGFDLNGGDVFVASFGP